MVNFTHFAVAVEALNLCNTISVIQTAHELFLSSCFLFSSGLGFLFFMLADWLLYVVRSIYNLVIESCLNAFHVDLRIKNIEKFSILMKKCFYTWKSALVTLLR